MGITAEQHRTNSLRHYYRRRAFAIQYLGGKCVRCGTTERLEFDHIDRRKKEFNISKLWSCSLDRLKAELKKCQLLCKDHHGDKSIAERGFKRAKGMHGTESTYRYCKCVLCRAGHNAYMRGYKARRKLA